MRIHKYLHKYDFPHHNFLLKNLDFFENHYKKGIKEANLNGGNNVMFIGNPIWDFLNKELLKIVHKNYYVDDYFIYNSLGIYIQNNDSNVPLLHNHMSGSIISGVFYINPPEEKEGGGLKLYFDNLKDPFIIYPKPNELYLFPSWAMHSPLPQTSSIPRICLNWGYHSRSRPIHKVTGDLW
jgi:hypothetical protein